MSGWAYQLSKETSRFNLAATLTMIAGNTSAYDVTVTVDGTTLPVDITGSTLWFTVKRNREDADPGLFQKTVGNGIEITNAAQGVATLIILPTDTLNLSPTIRYVWDFQVRSSLGVVQTAATGYLSIQPRVTQAIS